MGAHQDLSKNQQRPQEGRRRWGGGGRLVGCHTIHGGSWSLTLTGFSNCTMGAGLSSVVTRTTGVDGDMDDRCGVDDG